MTILNKAILTILAISAIVLMGKSSYYAFYLCVNNWQKYLSICGTSALMAILTLVGTGVYFRYKNEAFNLKAIFSLVGLLLSILCTLGIQMYATYLLYLADPHNFISSISYGTGASLVLLLGCAYYYVFYAKKTINAAQTL